MGARSGREDGDLQEMWGGDAAARGDGQDPRGLCDRRVCDEAVRRLGDVSSRLRSVLPVALAEGAVKVGYGLATVGGELPGAVVAARGADAVGDLAAGEHGALGLGGRGGRGGAGGGRRGTPGGRPADGDGGGGGGAGAVRGARAAAGGGWQRGAAAGGGPGRRGGCG